jgi:hypothetical protein
MIRGLTNQPATLACIRKIAIGDNLGKRGAPRKLDYFRLASGDPIPKEAIVRARDPEKTRPIALACNLAPLEPDQIFSTAMRAYNAASLWCSGDNGATATRRDGAGNFRPVEGGCNDCEHNPFNHDPGWRAAKGRPMCKPNGRLSVILKGQGATEATRITTGSKWSILNLSGFIERFSGLGPALWTIPVELRVTMQRVSVPGRARTPLPILSLHTSDTVPQLMDRVEAAAAGRMLSGESPRLLPGPGVSDESVDEEPASTLLYHEASEPIVQDDRLAQLEDAAILCRAEIGGAYIRRGFVAFALGRGKAPEEVRKRLEIAILGVGGALPKQTDTVEALFHEA